MGQPGLVQLPSYVVSPIGDLRPDLSSYDKMFLILERHFPAHFGVGELRKRFAEVQAYLRDHETVLDVKSEPDWAMSIEFRTLVGELGDYGVELAETLRERLNGQWPASETGGGLNKRKSLRDWAGAERIALVIVFTDIVESTALGKRLGDETMKNIQDAHFAQGTKLLQGCEGWQVKTIGDSIMAVFRNTGKALDFATALRSDPGHSDIQVRAGIHIGEVFIEENDISGESVNFAKRVVDAAEGPEIRLSNEAYQAIKTHGAEHHGHLQWERHDGIEMKGFDDTATLWSLVAPGAPRAQS